MGNLKTCFAAILILGLSAGCTTDGISQANETLDAASCGDAPALNDAQKCLAGLEKIYRDTAVEYTKESQGWNNGFVALATGGAGASAYDSGAAALKAIGLALGGATAFNQVRTPSTIAALYREAADATQCIRDLASTVKEDQADKIQGYSNRLMNDIPNAQAYLNDTSASSDKNLPLLTAAITSANAALVVAQNAGAVAKNPGEFFMQQAEAVDLQVLAKLNSTPLNPATIQQSITASVANETAKNTATSGANAPVPVGGGGAAAAAAAAQDAQTSQSLQQTADQKTTDLKLATQNLTLAKNSLLTLSAGDAATKKNAQSAVVAAQAKADAAKKAAQTAQKSAAQAKAKAQKSAAKAATAVDAVSWVLRLQNDIQAVLWYSQALADAKTQAPVCLTRIPS